MLQPQPLPRAGSAVGSDWAAQGFTQSEDETPRDGDPAPLLGCPSREKASPYLWPEPLMFQLVPLRLSPPPHTTAESLAMSPPSPPVSAGDAVKNGFIPLLSSLWMPTYVLISLTLDYISFA